MKRTIALLVFCAACTGPAEGPMEAAEAIARAEFGSGREISSLTETADGRAFCGFLLSNTGGNARPFIIEDGEVTMLGDDPAPYLRCGENYRAPF